MPPEPKRPTWAHWALGVAWGVTWLLGAPSVLAVDAETAGRRFADTLPAVELGRAISFRCAGDRQLVVRYGRLSDGSLSFARLQLPGDRTVTLPQLVAASGTRYSDGRQWQWWSKGSGGFLEERDRQGRWQKRFADCHSIGSHQSDNHSPPFKLG